MLIEGVPAAMIENAARMAGMPVGPLSLNDEVAIDLAQKIVKATKARARRGGRRTRRRRSSSSTMVESTAASAARTARASTTIRESGPEAALAGPQGPLADAARSRHDRRRGAEAALPRHAGARGGAHGRGGRRHRSARGRCRLDPRLRLRALHRRRALLHRRHGREGASSACAERAARRSTATRFAAPKILRDMAASGGTFYGRAEARKAA